MTPDSRLSTDDYRPETVLITGGCGFIGTNLLKCLLEKGYRCKILDNFSSSAVPWIINDKNAENHFSNLYPGFSGNDLIIGDVRDSVVVAKAIQGVDYVVHLAAHTNVIASIENPKEGWDINVAGTINLLEACRRNQVANFISASSNAVVGEQTPPIDESKMPRPLSPYGASKLAGEALCSAYYHSYSMNTICLRFANCYGPYSEHKTSVISKFIKQITSGDSLTIYGDGNQTRDFVHVDDVCQAIHLCLTKAESVAGEVFQVASGIETSINDLVSIICEAIGKKTDIINEPARKGEIQRNFSDINKAKELLGFDPKMVLSDGLKKLL